MSFGMRRGWILVALLGCLAASLAPAQAGPRDRLESIDERQRKLERRQARLALKEQGVAAVLADLDRKRLRAETELGELDAKIDRLNGRIGVVEGELTAAQQRLAALTDELLLVQKDLVDRTHAFTERAVAMYKAGPTAAVDSLLSSDSFSELVDRFAYYESALNEDSAMVERIQVLRDKTDAQRAQVEKEKDAIARAKLRLEADRSAVAAARREQAVVVAAKRDAVAAKQAVLDEVRSDQARVAEIQRQLEADEARIQAILAAASSAAGPIPSGGGQLLWPAAGPLTSGYGPRTHPIFGDTRMHTGIDIGAPYGAPVIAADAGIVAFAGAMSGYGNVIAIDHGGGLGTTYNHLSAFYVGAGDRVGRGEQIGAVGCSGYCTGPHLHFEVRINGSPVDPMPYLQ